MPAEAVGQILGLLAFRGAFAHRQYFIAGLFQGPLKACRGHLVPPVDHMEQPPQPG